MVERALRALELVAAFACLALASVFAFGAGPPVTGTPLAVVSLALLARRRAADSRS